jgi:hypothetical protein
VAGEHHASIRKHAYASCEHFGVNPHPGLCVSPQRRQLRPELYKHGQCSLISRTVALRLPGGELNENSVITNKLAFARAAALS